MDQYQQFIHKSRYARWIPEESRRETWAETVNRYVDFWVDRGQIDESMMKVYLDAAQEEINKEVKETKWWKQHIENLESLDTESSVSSQPYQPVPKEVEELLSTDEGQKQWLAEWEAKEEFDKEMKETEWWKQHIENLERQLRLSEEKFDRLLSVHEAAMEMWRREKEALEGE